MALKLKLLNFLLQLTDKGDGMDIRLTKPKRS